MGRKKLAKPSPLPQPVPCPPAMEELFVRLAAPRGTAPLDAVCVSQRMLGFNTHFVDNKQVPCIGPGNDCQGCALRVAIRWTGYLGAVILPSRRRRVLAITRGAAQHSPSLKEHDGQLRGMAIRLQRIGEGRNAPVKVQVARPREPIPLPEDWDIVGNLYMLWGISPASRKVGESERPTVAGRRRQGKEPIEPEDSPDE